MILTTYSSLSPLFDYQYLDFLSVDGLINRLVVLRPILVGFIIPFVISLSRNLTDSHKAASNFASFLDKLSKLFIRLESCCPRYAEYQFLFSNAPGLQNALCVFYATVVRFCAKSIQIVQRPGEIIFSSLIVICCRADGSTSKGLCNLLSLFGTHLNETLALSKRSYKARVRISRKRLVLHQTRRLLKSELPNLNTEHSVDVSMIESLIDLAKKREAGNWSMTSGNQELADSFFSISFQCTTISVHWSKHVRNDTVPPAHGWKTLSSMTRGWLKVNLRSSGYLAFLAQAKVSLPLL